jgi:hypothetical protein
MSIAGRTYLELQDEVLEFQFSPNKYRPLVKRWLNEAQRQVAISAELRDMETTTAVTTTPTTEGYVLPENYGRLLDFFYIESHELVAPMDVRDLDALPESTGRPYAYVVRDDELILYPTPDGVYTFTLRYWKLPADMVADSDEPELPVQYHQTLIGYPMWKAYLRENDYAAASTWQAIWEQGLLKLRGEVQHDSFDGPRQVDGSWGDAHGIPPYASWR